MKLRNLMLSSLAAAVLFAAPAHATLYQYTVNNPAGNDAAGNVTNIVTTFDDVTQFFSWEFTIEDVGGNLADGFTLAVSPGPNPKGFTGELALLYGDVDTNRLTIYEYNGQNNALSYANPGNLIGTFALNVVDNGSSSRTISFGFDASGVNGLNLSAHWTGVEYGSLIGYWFHPLLGSNFTYNGNAIQALHIGTQGWYDYANQHTSEVPEPATLLLMGAGLLGLPLSRKKRTAA